jgi:hypothetical protein
MLLIFPKAEVAARRCFALSVLFAGVTALNVAFAQSYDNPTLGQNPVVAHPQDYKPLGVRAGSFMLHPGVELAAEWHDNILYTQDNTISDTVFHVRPYITAQSTWSRHSFSVRLAADVARYADYGFRDYEDYFFQVGGHLDISSQSVFSYGLDYLELHEERNVRSADQGIEPTTYSLTGGTLGYDHTFNRLSLGLGYILRDLQYDNSIDEFGNVIDNSDRDRRDQVFDVRLGYQMQTDKQLFVQAGFNDVEYDQRYDRNGFDRSSSGWFASAGIDFMLTGVLSGNAYVTIRERSYSDELLPDVSGWGFGAGLTWMPTTLTTLRGTVSTSIEDTTQSTASGYFRTMYALRADHELLRDLQIHAQLAYYVNDYELLPDAPPNAREEDELWRVGVGATWFINRWAWISASYDFSDFTTNFPNDDYQANIAWLVLGFER